MSSMEPNQMKPSFTDQDTERLVALLNFVALNAKFSNLDIKQMLEFTKLLNYVQRDLLVKIEAHKFEILDVKQPVPSKGKSK